MSKAARDVAINKFREDPDCKVFLMSMKVGVVALNLTVASHVSCQVNKYGAMDAFKTCSSIGCLWAKTV